MAEEPWEKLADELGICSSAAKAVYDYIQRRIQPLEARVSILEKRYKLLDESPEEQLRRWREEESGRDRDT